MFQENTKFLTKCPLQQVIILNLFTVLSVADHQPNTGVPWNASPAFFTCPPTHPLSSRPCRRGRGGVAERAGEGGGLRLSLSSKGGGCEQAGALSTTLPLIPCSLYRGRMYILQVSLSVDGAREHHTSGGCCEEDMSQHTRSTQSRNGRSNEPHYWGYHPLEVFQTPPLFPHQKRSCHFPLIK